MKFIIICDGREQFESSSNYPSGGFCSEKAAIKHLQKKWSGIEFKDRKWTNKELSAENMFYFIREIQ
jgi:hypothetical protein